MVLAKAEREIAENYDTQLVGDAVPESLISTEDKSRLQRMGSDLRVKLDAAKESVLRVNGHGDLIETNPMLRRSMDVRNPYVQEE